MMTFSARLALGAVALPLALALAGCGSNNAENLDALDNELVDADNAVDPALAAALEDQIMVDPALAQQANGDAIRPPAQPYAAPVPSETIGGNAATPTAATDNEQLMSTPAPAGDGKDCPACDRARDAVTLGALAARQSDPRTKGCVANIRYSTHWAERLPTDLPLHPQARVTEAAGTQSSNCALRVVAFSTAMPVQKVMDWYYTRASRAGYAADHQADGGDHVLGGTRKRDGGAFVLFLSPRGDGGTDADLVVNNGR